MKKLSGIKQQIKYGGHAKEELNAWAIDHDCLTGII